MAGYYIRRLLTIIPTMFVVAEGRGLARGAHRHQSVNATGDLALDEAHEGVLVHRPISERRDHCR